MRRGVPLAVTALALAAAPPDLHLALGDLSYGTVGGESAWCRFVADRVGTRLPFELLSGVDEPAGHPLVRSY